MTRMVIVFELLLTPRTVKKGFIVVINHWVVLRVQDLIVELFSFSRAIIKVICLNQIYRDFNFLNWAFSDKGFFKIRLIF
jgi:hypothetical protein